jgi:hypothetical protein
LTARRPFSVDDDPQLLMSHIVRKAPPPLLRNEVPHGLSTIILDKLLAKDRDDRYQTMGDVMSALEQFITRGDGTPLPRRRSAPMIPVPASDGFEEQQETSARLPKPAPMRQTPWPVETLDTPMAMGQVSLPAPPPVKRPYALYGIAGAGIIMGVLGLVVGLRGNDAAPTPAPVVITAPAAATAPMPAAPEKIEVSLDADIPHARVVFRRRVLDTPAKLEINATDVVELVEVSATGYKTTRYWLTFDRATFLTAHLVKGTGSVEATEEETLAALGEVIMVNGTAPAVAAAPTPAIVAPAPRAPAVAAALPTPVAKTVEKPAPAAQPAASPPVAMAPRKIGRGAVDGEPVAQPTPEPAKEEPKVEPTPAAEEPKKDEPKVEPEKVVEAPKVEPKVEEIVRPSLDRGVVSSVIATHRPEVLKCFAEGKKKNAAMKGTLNLQLQVNAAGAVSRVQVQSTLNNPLVAACVAKAANTWKFPARKGGEVATVAYPFTIN